MSPAILIAPSNVGGWNEGDQAHSFPTAAYLTSTQCAQGSAGQTAPLTQESFFLFVHSIIMLKKKAHLASGGGMDKVEEKNIMWSYK